MLKRFFLSGLLLIGLASASHGKGAVESLPVYNFAKGLDSFHSSLSLPDGFVQDANNVYFDRAAPVEKRQGYTVAFTTKAYSYQTAWNYVDASNTTWLIVRSSDQITASNLTGSIVRVATMTANDSVSEVNAFGNAYFVDPTQGVYYWNGSATTYIVGSPKGSIIAQFHGRVWVAGQAIPNGNLLNGSKYLDGTTWTPGINPNDPVQFTVGLQDAFDNISALYPFIDTLYVTKHYSISALYGFDQSNFQVSFITGECGCVDGQSIQTFNHMLYFVSLRGLETFDGYSCTRISDPIKNKIDVAIQSQAGFNAQTWYQSSQSDFNSGTYSTTVYDTSVGGVDISTADSNTPDNSFETYTGFWTATGAGGGAWYGQITGVAGDCSGTLGPFDGTYFTGYNCASGLGCGTATVSIVDAVNNTTYGSFPVPYSHSSGGGCAGHWVQHTISGITAPVRTPVQIKIAIPDGAFTSTIYSNVFGYSGSNVTFYSAPLLVGGGFTNFFFDFFQGGQNASRTGVFVSPSHGISGATTFGNFSVNQTLNTGTMSYAICTSASSNMASKVCANQTANAQIVVATNTFVQAVATFTVLSGTYTPVLSNFSLQWYTGNRAPPMASTVWDNRYWLALTTATTDTVNDDVLVVSNQNVFTSFDIHAGGFTQFKDNLYHSDSTATGNIYLDNQGFADNGNSINAYIKTKDFSMGDLTQDSFIDSIWPSMDNLGSFNVAVNYFVDRATTTYPLGTLNQTEFAASASVKLPFPLDAAHQDFGKTLSYQFIANDPTEPWKFYGFREILHSRPTQ